MAEIKKITLRSGTVRYRFVVDIGYEPKMDPVTGDPVVDGKSGKPVMQRKQLTVTKDTLKEARAELARIQNERDSGKVPRGERRPGRRARGLGGAYECGLHEGQVCGSGCRGSSSGCRRSRPAAWSPVAVAVAVAVVGHVAIAVRRCEKRSRNGR
ncbi:hypothetical protein ACJ6WF_36185 [Streptomyces sp. MMS24-I2-30]|uniref:hypothetical protein n=1 Tax=Streptomyces sp. MMS24-I2-30 TaxID=3351564 RepID=UPI0038968971